MSPAPAPLQLFSVVIPARDEEESLPSTLQDIYETFTAEKVPHEIVVVDDGSRDRTWGVLQELRQKIPTLAPTQNASGAHGFGRAVIWGLEHSRGDAVVIMMADASDSPDERRDLLAAAQRGPRLRLRQPVRRRWEVIDYPRIKLLVNRIANCFGPPRLRHSPQRHHQRLQGLPPHRHRRLPALSSRLTSI
jgi:dolichol-phosphate mannosyltransferase